MCSLNALRRCSADRACAFSANSASTSFPNSVLFSRYLDVLRVSSEACEEMNDAS